ncbi:DUF1700 domain-containing protein [Microbacterium sp. Mu-80]|uniref:DUF1700 domain-containing protein n=1 Tax=Microbacterium bandirmense TaxID=3122050 RepID=A0ABU8LDZ1_9MICO
MSTEDTYLRSVERMLRDIAPEHRTAVLDDLRQHFADAEEAGRSADEIAQSLGTPREIADRAHDEFGTTAGPVDARAEFAWRMLQWSAVVLAVVTGVVTAFVMPSYAGSTEIVASDGTVIAVETAQTLLAVNGLWIALIALVPAIVAAVPLMVPRRVRAATAAVTAVLLTAMALIGGFTLGGFFVPTAMLSWAALIAWVRLRDRGFGVVWRIVGAVLTVLPIALSLPLVGGMPGRYADTAGPSVSISAWAWPFFAAIVLIAVLMVIGYRAPGWALAAIGLAVLVTGLLTGDLLTLLIIWLGGFWLTIGLAHAVTARRR